MFCRRAPPLRGVVRSSECTHTAAAGCPFTGESTDAGGLVLRVDPHVVAPSAGAHHAASASLCRGSTHPFMSRRPEARGLDARAATIRAEWWKGPYGAPGPLLQLPRLRPAWLRRRSHSAGLCMMAAQGSTLPPLMAQCDPAQAPETGGAITFTSNTECWYFFGGAAEPRLGRLSPV